MEMIMARDSSPPATAAAHTLGLAQSSNPPPPPKSGAMNPAGNMSGASARSPLEKPLAELTEEDIAQLTREDCRRFLKDKGMRRPSWNKSQAIQQVISLKALLEGRPGCDDSPVGPGILCNPSQVVSSAPALATLRSPGKEVAGQSQVPEPAKEPSPYRRRDPIPSLFCAGDSTCHVPVTAWDHRHPPENRCHSPRVTAEASAEGQMTIFYDGKVNVYDGVTAEQMRLIMEIAATPVRYDPLSGPGPVPLTRPPVSLPLPPVFSGPVAVPATASSVGGLVPTTSVTGRSAHQVADAAEEWRAPRVNEPECFTSRKASLQRYLEKKKERFKGKKIVSGASANMEMMYLTQKFRGQNTWEQLSSSDRSNTLPQPPGTPTRCSSKEIQTQKEKFSIDLNEDAGGI